MKKSDVEALLRRHFVEEVGAEPVAHAGPGAPTEAGHRRWTMVVAAVALVAILPALMIFGGRETGPLPRAIDQAWQDGGAEMADRLLTRVRDIARIGHMSSKEE